MTLIFEEIILQLNDCSSIGGIVNDNKIEVCGAKVINLIKVERVISNLPNDSEIHALAESFKVISDPTRLRIVLALSMEELCVCDLATLLNVSISAVSHQLRLLKGSKIVTYRKAGKMVYYSLDDDHVRTLIDQAREHIGEDR